MSEGGKGGNGRDSYDLIVIGAGPGGYVCAIRAAQLGMRAAIIDARETPGGTCLNIGCIPSKALLHASRLYEAQKDLSAFGVEAKAPKLNLKAMMAYKEESVEANVKGVGFLLKKNKVAYRHGRARLVSAGAVEVGGERLQAPHIVIATGSDPAAFPNVKMDETRILSSTGALSLSSVPKSLAVVGAGYIGLEMGSVWRRLGAEVVILEALPRIAPGMDGEIARHLGRLLEKQGLQIRAGVKVKGIAAGKKGAEIAFADKNDALFVEKVLIAVGRTPLSGGLGLEALGVKISARGFIETDEACRTSEEGIYAIGDVAGGAMLAHKASEEGVVLAENLCGIKSALNREAIPSVIYTHPEAASVGKTEEALKEEGADYKTGRFPFTANGRAKVNREAEGFVKILAQKGSDRILGVHILGAEAGLMIAQAVTAIEFGAAAEDLARTIHAHPTLSEAMKEAALSAEKRALHM